MSTAEPTPAGTAAHAQVLEAAGCDVVIPARSLCCGRPLYDYGFLEQAKRLLAMAASKPASNGAKHRVSPTRKSAAYRLICRSERNC